MFTDVDLMVTDISSIGLDFLYLRPEVPLIISDRRNDLENLNESSPITRATPVISTSTIESFDSILNRTLDEDPHVTARKELRALYFGERSVGDSTRAFVTTIDSLIQARQADLTRQAEHPS